MILKKIVKLQFRLIFFPTSSRTARTKLCFTYPIHSSHLSTGPTSIGPLSFVMTFPLVLLSVFTLLHQSTAAPFTDRSGNSRPTSALSNTGWICTYDGQANPAMDPDLDLPQLVASLCSQVPRYSSHHTCGRMLSEHMI